MQDTKEVLILGGGYAALSFVKNLPASCFTQARFRLITKSAQHYTSVLLHESVSMDKHIGHSYERILPAQVECIYDEVLRIEQGRVIARGGEWGYDVLVVALGFASDDFGIAGIAEYAYPMVDLEGCKNLHAFMCEKLQAFNKHSACTAPLAESALSTQSRTSSALNRASLDNPQTSGTILECQDSKEADSNKMQDSQNRSESTPLDSHPFSESTPLESSAPDSIKIQKAPQGKLRFVICGGGFSGIELIASLAEELPALCARYGLKRDSVELMCVEAMAQILPMFPPALMQKALDYLNAQGVKVETNCKILEVLESGVRVEQSGEVRVIESHLTFWSAGVKGSPVIAESEFFTSARSKVEVDSHLQPINQAKQDSMSNVFVLGDCAAFKDPSSGRFFPPTAQIAIRQGAWLAGVFPAVLSGTPIAQDFHFASRGSVCSLGSRFAIGLVGERHISGRLAIWIKRWIEFSWLAKLKGYLAALAKS